MVMIKLLVYNMRILGCGEEVFMLQLEQFIQKVMVKFLMGLPK